MNTNNNRHGQGTFGASRNNKRSSYSQNNRGGSKFYGARTKKYSGGRSGQNRGGRGGGRKMPTFNPSQFINTNPTTGNPDKYLPKNNFGSFGLDARLVNTIRSRGMSEPTPIQDQIIPEILSGRDVIGLAETGTGKTAAFLIPLIEKNIKNPHRQTLILAPTRELALQIKEELQKLSYDFKIFSVVCVGGMNIRPQISALKRRNQFVIGTPGRMLDLIRNRHFNPINVSTVVLDEADRMLDMGFIKDVRSILSTTPKERETLFFSATMTQEAKKLVHDFLKNPITISVKKQDVANSIEQNVVPYKQPQKFETLVSLLRGPEFKRVLIFGSMKHSVRQLAQQLYAQQINTESIHGNKSHSQRQHALEKFKKGAVQVLVATDVAARGIHVEGITHVINYDLPNTFEDYVHRIGRTGRGTKKGKALTFVPA